MASWRVRIRSLVLALPYARRIAWGLSRRARIRGAGYFDWARAVGSRRDALASPPPGGKRILVATSVGAFFPAMAGEGVLGAALALRGHDVHYLLCDSVLPACLDCELRWAPSLAKFGQTGPQAAHCSSCFPPGLANYSQIGPPVHRYSETLTAQDHAEAAGLVDALPASAWEAFTLDGVQVGNHAKAGLLRFLARGTLTGKPDETAVYRRYMLAGILTLRAVQRLIAEQKFDIAVLHHGIYIPQGIIAEACRVAGVRVVTWNVGYRKNCLLFSHNETYHHGMMTEPVSAWEGMAWSERHDAFIGDYLKSRWHGTNDWIWFHDRPSFDVESFARETGYDPAKPTIGLLTNVFWDAQLHYPENVFPNMLEWIFQTVEYFATRPDLQLLIRVHPAEIRGTVPAREKVVPALRERFPNLPANVFVVAPENRISTYPIMEACNAVIIYGTKTGVELSSMGIPTIVAGEAWIKNKGITIDPASRAGYLEELARLPAAGRMPEDRIARARRYAFHFFFRRMIPLPFLKPGKGVAPFEVSLEDVGQLAEGRDPGLDVICRGIVEGTPFIYPQEEKI
jgi:hypothetical protein